MMLSSLSPPKHHHALAFSVDLKKSALLTAYVNATESERIPRYACHRCAATSYRALMARGADGAMRPSGRHACSGCHFEFDSLQEWMQTTQHPRQQMGA